MQLNAAEYANLVNNIRRIRHHGYKINVSLNKETFYITQLIPNGNYFQIGNPYKTIDECFAFIDGLIGNA